MYESLDTAEQGRGAPSPLLSLAELPRTLCEAAGFGQFWPLLTQAPQGDGHPVLVLPGFTASDASTLPLRRFLDRLGYRTLPWEVGTNTGSLEVQSRMVLRFYRLVRTYRQPLTLIGQSLGGVFAREIARRFPDHVRSVITLGSPFASADGRGANPIVRQLFERLSGLTVREMRSRVRGGRDIGAPIPVPCTAVYSRTDGVVSWRACLERDAPLAENVEIVGSHSGMAMNPAAVYVIADRLAQPVDGWRRFDRSVGLRALIYPEPSYAQDAGASD